MRRLGVFGVLLVLGCGNSDGGLQGQAQTLPLDALTVARYAAARFGTPISTLAIDPTIAADLDEIEDDGCLTDSTSPSPLASDANIYTLTTTYNNCGAGVISAVTGTRAITASVDNANAITNLASSFQLAFIQADGSPLNLSSNTNVTLNGNATSGNVSRAYVSTGTWTTPDATQGSVQNFNNTLTLRDTYDLTSQLPTGTTLDGNYAQAYAGTSQGYTVSYQGVVLHYSQCCLPLGGSISESQVFDDGSTDTTTWTFGSTCGAVNVNGQAITITACP